MRVAIVGAGALGSVYGARLALRGGCDVSVVARVARSPSTVRLEKVDDGDVLLWPTGEARERPPPDADVILVFVRYEQLGDVAARLDGASAPVVVMTPMMPDDRDALTTALPGRVVAAMPSVVAYRSEAGAIRYWLPRVATTLVEERAHPGAEAELVQHLAHAGIPARLAPDVLERDVATTVSFLPLAMALDAAGSTDALLADRPLLALAIRAAAEGRALGATVGKAEAWASTLLRFVGPRTLRLGVRLARARAPEAMAYVEHHFGRKLHAQNVAMAARTIALARARGTPSAALSTLLVQLRARGDA